MNLHANNNVIRSRSKSLMKSDCCSIYLDSIQGYTKKQRSLSHESHRLQKELQFEKNFIFRKSSSSSSISSMNNEIRNKYNILRSCIKESMPNCTLRQRNQQRYIDILQEVKKILRNDVPGKRKLKYVLKKCLTCNNSNSNVIFRRTCEKTSCITKNKQVRNINENQACYYNLKYFQSKLLVDDRENSKSDSLKNIARTEHLVDNSLVMSSLLQNTERQAGSCSRTPSPALPLLRDESEISKQNTFYNYNARSSITDVKTLYKNFEWSDTSYMMLDSTCLKTPKSLSKSVESLKVTNFGKFSNHTSIKKSDTNYNFGNLSTKLGMKLYSRSLTPEKITLSESSSPIFSRNSGTISIALTESAQLQKTRNLLNSSALSLSPVPVSSPKSSELSNYYKNISCNVTFDNSRFFTSKISHSMSSSTSYNSKETHIRSCSNESSHSSRSSSRRSSDSYSYSSCSQSSGKASRIISSNSSRSRSPSIPRRYGSPSFLDRRRITSARKRPIPYHRPTPSPTSSPSTDRTSYDSDWSTTSNRSSQTASENS